MARPGTIANAATIHGREGVGGVVAGAAQGAAGDERGVEALRPPRSSKGEPEVAANVAPFLDAFPKLGSLLENNLEN